jgi:hypothetical protein
MTRFDKFCNLILEVYGKRIDIPYDGRNAADRYNNPGGAYPSAKFVPFGLEGHGIIGGGHPIGKYPTVANGVAANIAHLRSMPVVGKTVGEARHYWVNGKMGGTMPLVGMNNNQVITAELLQDPNWLAQWMKATATAEGFKGNLNDNTFAKAFDILGKASSFTPSQQYAGTGATQQDGTSQQPPEGGEKDKEQSPYAAMFAQYLPSAAGGFTKEKGAESLKGIMSTAVGAIEGMTGQKIPTLASSKNARQSSDKVAKNDVDAFLGKGRWKETPEQEKETKAFLGEV